MEHDGETISDKTNDNDDNDLYKNAIGSLPYGDYNFTLKDIFENTVDIDTTIPQPPQLSLAIDTIIPPKCLGGNTGEIELTNLNGGNKTESSVYKIFHKKDQGDYSYPLQVAGTDTTLRGIEDNTSETIKMEDSAGCYQTFDTLVGENQDAVELEVKELIDPTCKDDEDGMIRVTATKGDTTEEGYYYFNILKRIEQTAVEGKTDTIKSLEGNPTDYIVYVEDSNECITGSGINTVDTSRYTDTVTLEHPDKLGIHFKNSMDVSYPGASDGRIAFSFSGGNNAYRYWISRNTADWENGTDTLATGLLEGEADVEIDGLAADLYSIHMEDTCGCTNGGDYFEGEFLIDKPPSLTLSVATKRDISCYGMDDGKVTLYADGGYKSDGGYHYKKDAGEWRSDNEFLNLSPGDYTFYVKDDRNVKNSVEVSLEEPDSLQAVVDSVVDVKCHGGASGGVFLDYSGGRAPYEYSVNSGGNWYELPGSGMIDNLEAGAYNIDLRDSSTECIDFTDEVSVRQPEELDTANVTIKNSSCGENHGKITAKMEGGTPPYSYEWFSKDGNQLAGGESIDSLASGVYKLIVTDQNECKKVYTNLSVDDTDAPEINQLTTSPVTCYDFSDGSVAFSIDKGISPYDFNYHDKEVGVIKDSLMDVTVQEHAFDSIQSGIYNLAVIDSVGCQRFKEFTIDSKEPLELNVRDNEPTCYEYSDGSVQLSAFGANGGYQYYWEDDYTGSQRDGLSSDNYSVTVEDSMGCSRDFDFYLDQPQKVQVDLGDDAIICGGMEYVLNPEGYNTYYWEKDGAEFSQTPNMITDEEGVYTLEVTDEKGCIGRDTFELEVDNDLLNADFLIPTEAFTGDTLAAIDISNPEPDSVSWNFEGSPGVFNWDPSESNPYTRFIQYSDTGKFDVKLFSVKAQCRDSVVKTVHILPGKSDTITSKSLGAKEDFIKSFNVFPNPSDGTFSVEVELQEKAEINLDMISTQQNYIIDRKKLSGLKHYRLTYGFNNLTPGVYILTLRVKDEKKSLRIIIT